MKEKIFTEGVESSLEDNDPGNKEYNPLKS